MALNFSSTVLELFQRVGNRLALRGRFFRQLPNLIGHNRKAFSGFSCVSSFNSGVHSEQVGLACNILDDARCFDEAAGGFGNFLSNGI